MDRHFDSDSEHLESEINQSYVAIASKRSSKLDTTAFDPTSLSSSFPHPDHPNVKCDLNFNGNNFETASKYANSNGGFESAEFRRKLSLVDALLVPLESSALFPFKFQSPPSAISPQQNSIDMLPSQAWPSSSLETEPAEVQSNSVGDKFCYYFDFSTLPEPAFCNSYDCSSRASTPAQPSLPSMETEVETSQSVDSAPPISPLPAPSAQLPEPQSQSQSLPFSLHTRLPTPPWAKLLPQPPLPPSSRGRKRKRTTPSGVDHARKLSPPASVPYARSITPIVISPSLEPKPNPNPGSNPVITYRLKTPTGSVVQKEDYMANFMHSIDISEAETIEKSQEGKLRKEIAAKRKQGKSHSRVIFASGKAEVVGGTELDFDPEVTKGRGSTRDAPNQFKHRALVDCETEDESGPVKGKEMEKENASPFHAGVDCTDVLDDDTGTEMEEKWTRTKEGRTRKLEQDLDGMAPRREIQRHRPDDYDAARIPASHFAPAPPRSSSSSSTYPESAPVRRSLSPPPISASNTRRSKPPPVLKKPKQPARRQGKKTTTALPAELETQTNEAKYLAPPRDVKEAEFAPSLLIEQAKEPTNHQRKKSEGAFKVEQRKQQQRQNPHIRNTAERERLWWEKEKEKKQKLWEAEMDAMKGVVEAGDTDAKGVNSVNSILSALGVYSCDVKREPKELGGEGVARIEPEGGNERKPEVDSGEVVQSVVTVGSAGDSEKAVTPVNNILATLGVYPADATWELRDDIWS